MLESLKFMPITTKKIEDLDAQVLLGLDDLVPVAVDVGGGTYVTKKVLRSDLLRLSQMTETTRLLPDDMFLLETASGPTLKKIRTSTLTSFQGRHSTNVVTASVSGNTQQILTTFGSDLPAYFFDYAGRGIGLTFGGVCPAENSIAFQLRNNPPGLLDLIPGLEFTSILEGTYHIRLDLITGDTDGSGVAIVSAKFCEDGIVYREYSRSIAFDPGAFPVPGGDTSLQLKVLLESGISPITCDYSFTELFVTSPVL